MKDQSPYCPIDAQEVYKPILKNPRGVTYVYSKFYCEKCKRYFRNNEVLWRMRQPKVTKKMLRYQAQLSGGV